MSTLPITLIQSQLHWEDPEKNRSMFEQKIATIHGLKSIVVLPETFTTAFSTQSTALAETMDGVTVRWMEEMASKYKIILTGSLMIKENDQYFNRLIWMQPDGQYGTYDKRHLFSYGGENRYFTPGHKRFIARVSGWKICTMICYDLRFPVWNRMHTADEYDVLLFIANWPAKRIDAWNTLLKARAIENQCFVIGLNRTGTDGNGIAYPGNSCVIDPLGITLFQAGESEISHIETLNLSSTKAVRKSFPFQNDKDEFIIL